jgi:hypothetical protein
LIAICFAHSLADSFIFLTLTRLVVVIIFENFSFALFTPPLGDYQIERASIHCVSCSSLCWVAGKGTGFYNFLRPYCYWEGSESGSRICDNYVV